MCFRSLGVEAFLAPPLNLVIVSYDKGVCHPFGVTQGLCEPQHVEYLSSRAPNASDLLRSSEASVMVHMGDLDGIFSSQLSLV